jgi:hypothetical protein
MRFLGIIRRIKLKCLDDQQLLDVAAGVVCVHAVPRSVCESTADSPHDGYGGFGGGYEVR